MKNLILSCSLALATFAGLAQGNVLFVQNFETDMNGFITFNEGSTSSAFTRGTPASFISDYFNVPNLAGSTYCAGFNDDAAGEFDAGSDVYMMTAYADYSMYDSVRVYFDYHLPSSYQGGYFVVGQTGDFNDMFNNALFYTLTNTTNWNSVYLTITPASFGAGYGMNNVSIGFNYYDDNDWAYGLVVDNVTVIGYRQSPNDECATAHVLTPQQECTTANAYQGNMSGSGLSIATSQCYPGGNAPDVWFKFVATTTDATVIAQALAVYDLDILLEIYEGDDCDNLMLFHCQDEDDIENNGTGEEVAELTGLTVGQNYYVRLFSVLGPTDIGGFRICVQESVVQCDEPTIDADVTEICPNEQATLTVTGATNVQWQKDGVNIAGQNALNYTATEAGTYSVVLTNAGCTNVTSNTIAIQVNVAPTRTQNVTICSGQSITVGAEEYSTAGTYTTTVAATEGCDSLVTTILTVTTINVDVVQAQEVFTLTPITGATYQWIDCETDQVIATTADFTATTNGLYKVIVTVGACTEESDCMEVQGLSVNALDLTNVQLYPNPTTGKVKINADNNITSIQVLDLNGRLINTYTDNDTTIDIDMSELNAGVYLFVIYANDAKSTQRVIKQ